MPRISPDNGRTINTPMYSGESFYRVVNEPSFKIAQTGSGTGTNSGGPGYTFKDEFVPSVRHDPYVLSMANSGPNSNGSQIFFTGDVSIPSLDDVHTIFGRITDPTSRSTIDAIMASGSGGSSITSVAILRTDPNALAFDENSQNLPEVQAAAGTLSVERQVASTFQLQAPLLNGDLLNVHRSENLREWSSLPSKGRWVGIDDKPRTSIGLDDASANAAFYQLARIHHPDAHGPSSINGREVTLNFPTEVHTYTINSAGNGGDLVISFNGGGSVTGTFTLDSPSTGPYGFSFVALTSLFLGTPPNQIPFSTLVKCGIDSSNPSELLGHQASSYFDYAPVGARFVPYGKGSCELTR